MAQRFIDRVKEINLLFLITVVLSTLLSAIYFGLIASDVYVSESRFMVASPQQKAESTPSISSLLQGGSSGASGNSYTVQEFINSRDALKVLNDSYGIIKSYSNSKLDRISRFPGINWDDSFEAFLLYYRNKIVTVDIDSTSSDTTLTVRAFSAEEAYRINEKLLELSEDLINKLNDRSRQDMIGFASKEVASAEKIARAAALALASYRDQQNVIDPEAQSPSQLALISKLQDELIAANMYIAQLKSFAKSPPQLPYLQKQAQILQKEIDEETDRVAGGKRSLADKAAKYQRLTLDRDYANQLLSTALASLQTARNQAQRKQLYLERVVQPNKPAIPIEPRRVRNVFVTFLLGLVVWGILSLLMAGVREHGD